MYGDAQLFTYREFAGFFYHALYTLQEFDSQEGTEKNFGVLQAPNATACCTRRGAYTVGPVFVRAILWGGDW